VERIVTVTGVEVSVDSFAATRPLLKPLFDVSRHPNRARTLFFSATGVTGKLERDGTRTPVNATLDPPAFYGNSADLVLASLPLAQGRAFDVAMWDADGGRWQLRLLPAVAETANTVDGATCDAWRVDSNEHGDAQQRAGHPDRAPRRLHSGGGRRTPVALNQTEQEGRDGMGFDQYHEPPNELPEEVRTFARMITSLIEEAEAIDWYEQRMSVEKDKEAKAIMRNAQKEEFKHFGMDLEFLLRKKPVWRDTLKGILFKDGDIVEHGEEAEEAAD
jgi:hypothetical protein